MPNVDGGHYFLTVLAPVRTDQLFQQGAVESSAVHMLRNALAVLPTAQQSRATEARGVNSPFARSRRTHLARFVVIDDVAYNGRSIMDAIHMAIRKVDPVVPQVQDHLTCPYLMFAAEFDAQADGAAALRPYLNELWSTMQAELQSVFQYCVGFEAVQDSASFATYIQKCQIETTMPFNDYWTETPPLKSWFNVLIGSVVGIALAAVVLIVALGMHGWPWLGAIVTGLVAFIVALVIPYGIVMNKGHGSLPTAPNTDLPSVLKALYLQRRFTRFAIDGQGIDDGSLHQKFGAFIAEHQPEDLTGPTQPPGVIGV